MTPLRFLMMTAALLVSAAAANAQGRYDYDVPPPAYAAYPAVPQAPSACPAMNAPTWFTQYLQQSMATWQKLRTLCSSDACCESACTKAAGCPVAAAGCVKCCDLAQAPASCCCAKACTCCETCKAKKEAAQCTEGPRMTPAPMEMKAAADMWIENQLKSIHMQQADRDRKMAEYYQRTGHPGSAYFYMEMAEKHRGLGQPMLPPVPPVPPAYSPRQVVQIHAIPMTPMTPPYSVAMPPAVRAIECTPPAPAVKHAHLMTPDLEAHCHRMTHRGDTILLEGDVLLLCKKHAQPIRIEAQRVIVNMKDGTFTVESDARPTVSTFGATRTSAVAPVTYYLPPGMPSPWQDTYHTPLPPVPAVSNWTR